MLQNTMTSPWEGMGLESVNPSVSAGTSTSGQQDFERNISPGSRFDNAKDAYTGTSRRSAIPKVSFSLKRSHEERDRDSDRSTPRQYSARPPMSPPILRQSFIPDRRDHWSPKRDPRPHAGSRSPESNRRRDRGDRWLPSNGAASPPIRPSPHRAGSSEYVEWPTPLSRSSPVLPSLPIFDRRNSDLREPPTYKNLTWKASDLDSKLHANGQKTKGHSTMANGSSPVNEESSVQRPGEGTSAKVNFNGLKDVPTGPKQTPSERSKLPSRPLPPVDRSIINSPHIFISSQSLPAQVSTTKHLHRFLKRYILEESAICVDESGWYLCFEDTPAGRERLEMCYDKANDEMLFSAYPLDMVCFPDGQSSSSANLDVNVNDITPLEDVDGAGNSASADAAAHADSFLENLDVSFGKNALVTGKVSTHHRSKSLNTDIAGNGAILSPPPMDAMLHHLRYSSPALRVPSRQDRDETSSSISGITGSDMSVSKRLKCHVCQSSNTFDSDLLIHCSSCPRRYHRRCHAQPAIPPHLERDHSWQCRRCIRKKIRPRSRLSNASPAADYSPAASVGQPEAPPTKKPRLEVAEQPTPVSSTTLLDKSSIFLNDSGNDAADHLRPEGEGNFHDSEDSYEPTDKTPDNSNESHFLEADDLVAKSFASLDAQAQSTEKPAPRNGRLNLLRRKIGRKERLGSHESNDDAKESNTSPQPITRVTTEPYPFHNSIGLVDDEIDGIRTYRKSHKWTGGGADKDIIEAGIGNLSSKHLSPPQNGVQNPFKTHEGSQTIDPDVIGEVLESPEATTISSVNFNAFTVEKLSELRTVRSPLNGEGKGSTPTVKHGGLTKESANQKQRFKPGAPAVAHCIKCQKKIAWQPSGTNKLCSRCKNEASLDSTPRSTKLFPEGLDKQTCERADKIHLTDESVAGEPGVQVVFTEESHLGKEADEEQATSEFAHQGLRKPSRPRTSCEKCRNQRRRCTHGPVYTPQEPIPTVAPEPRASLEVEREDDGSEGDLDFWKAKSMPIPTQPANDNELSPYKNVQHNVESDADIDGLPGHNEGSNQHSPDEHLVTDAPVSFQAKRQSQTRPATNAHDLGDSFSRPPNTYVKLIGMALCSAPDHRLKGNDIVQWVIKNVPSYKAGEGKWESSLRATMTLKREGYNGGAGLWRIVNDGSKKNQGYVWELLPGAAENMLHWDPVLGQPVSPPKGWRIRQQDCGDGGDVVGKPHQTPTFGSPKSPVRSTKARRRRSDDSARKPHSVLHPRDRSKMESPDESTPSEVDGHGSLGNALDSSEDEPLSRRRRSRGAPTAFADIFGSSPSKQDDNDAMDIDLVPDLKQDSMKQRSLSLPRTQASKRNLVSRLKIEGPTLEELIAIDSKKINYSAKSLYDEWPEYDPKNEFDRDAKIAEIKSRPTRKQRFGKQNNSVEMDAKGPISLYVFSGTSWSPERPRRANRNAAYPWEAGEENLIYCDSIEELFNLPTNPYAIIHNGELAYRDASKNPRIVYKTGYA